MNVYVKNKYEYKGFKYEIRLSKNNKYAILEYNEDDEETKKKVNIYRDLINELPFSTEYGDFLWSDTAVEGFLEKFGLNPNSKEDHIKALEIRARNQIDHFFALKNKIKPAFKEVKKRIKEKIEKYKTVISE